MAETFVITISGSGHGVGKTLLAERLLPCLPNCAAVKVQVRSDDALIVRAEDGAEQSPGKDTSRFLAAGARRAFLIRGSVEQAQRAAQEIIASGEYDVVVMESGALSRELRGDLSFFVKGAGEAKPGADLCEERADVTVTALAGRRS